MSTLLPDLAQMFVQDRGLFGMPNLTEWCPVWPQMLETHGARSGSDLRQMKFTICAWLRPRDPYII